ncbi:MAG: glycoside hydrolase N-terminal domain-containing protein, partial [Bacteroidetes bacterium]|nr:glycoside hydrolase N-terminal domain-containing protein [Bacteroidota bacterium]
MKNIITFLLLFSIGYAQTKPEHNLVFDSLANRWDEAMPLGNGMLGALVWEKNDRLRISLDRADLWDERQVLDLDKLNFRWVQQQIEKNQYDTVHKIGDDPYEASPYPTKIPAGALEFDISKFGKVVLNVLDISRALNTIKFQNGTVCNIYIHASKQAGYFGFENLPSATLIPQLIIPDYNNGENGNAGNSVEGQGLQKLGYKKGIIISSDSDVVYHQPTWGSHYYEIKIQWKKFSSNHIIGAWTISNDEPVSPKILLSESKEPTGWLSHEKWWNTFWNRSSVSIPDKLIEKQYYL